MNLFDMVPEQPTWQILDSSKLTEYMTCARKFMYRYVFGWQPAYPNNHLVFGSAWHMALEHLLRNRYSRDSIIESTEIFNRYYREYFPVSTDELYAPKTPLNAALSLADYAQKHAWEANHFTVLHTEIGGIVLVAPHRTMTFKHDAILQDNQTGVVRGDDHKTSQRKDSQWGDHWTLSTQMNTYLHALHCLYPDQSEELSMLVRCSFFYKKSPTLFEEHSIQRTNEQMQTWLTKTNVWIDRMDYDWDMLVFTDTEDATLQAYPMNDTSCFNYGRKCEYFDLCNAWANPLTRCDSPPMGFNVTWWNPLAQPELNEIVDLTQEKGA